MEKKLRCQCPCCDQAIYRQSTICPKCGYMPHEAHIFYEFAKGYRTVTSILLGFCSTALVELTLSEKSGSQNVPLTVAVVSWSLTSVILLISLLYAERGLRYLQHAYSIDIVDEELQKMEKEIESKGSWLIFFLSSLL